MLVIVLSHIFDCPPIAERLSKLDLVITVTVARFIGQHLRKSSKHYSPRGGGKRQNRHRRANGTTMVARTGSRGATSDGETRIGIRTVVGRMMNPWHSASEQAKASNGNGPRSDVAAGYRSRRQSGRNPAAVVQTGWCLGPRWQWHAELDQSQTRGRKRENSDARVRRDKLRRANLHWD